MPTKTRLKSKTRTSKTGLSNKRRFQFRWWMGLVLVGVVAVVGLLVLRFSHASSNLAGNSTDTVINSQTVQDLSKKFVQDKATAQAYDGQPYGYTEIYCISGSCHVFPVSGAYKYNKYVIFAAGCPSGFAYKVSDYKNSYLCLEL